MSTHMKHIRTILSLVMFEDGHNYYLNQYMIEQSETFMALHDQLDAKLDALIDSVALLTVKVEELEQRVNPNRD